MGKFDGVLIISDYDNTISYTEGALRSGRSLPPVSPENRQAMAYFMAEGGTFCVATGRAAEVAEVEVVAVGRHTIEA